MKRFLIYIVTVLAFACSSDDSEPILGVQNIIVSDNGNAGDASDIEVNFSQPTDPLPISEFRVIAVKEAMIGSFDLPAANNLDPSRYMAADPEDVIPVKGVSLSSATLDADGDVIDSESRYVIAVLTVSGDSDTFSNSLAKDDASFQLSLNNLITNFTQDLQLNAGSLVIDNQGTIFMAEYSVIGHLTSDTSASYFIRKITSTAVNELGSQQSFMSGTAFDNNGNIYTGFLQNGRINKTTPAGITTPVLTNFGLLESADGIYIDENDVIYVADPVTGDIVRIEDGDDQVFARVRNTPRGITRDENGNFYVSHNHEDGIISKILPDGSVSTLANIPTFLSPNYQIEFLQWVGYITYHQGFLYVVSSSSRQIFKVSLDGEVELFAGSGNRGVARGDALTANLNRPIGIVFSPDGSSMYVSEATDTQPQHTQYSTPMKILEIKLVE